MQRQRSRHRRYCRPATSRHPRTTDAPEVRSPIASVADLILLLGACSDDDQPTTTSEPAVGAVLAKGEEVQLAGEVTSGIRNQTLNIDAHQQAGEATGEVRFDDNVIRVECADTALGGRVVLGGTATAGSYLKVATSTP